MNVVVFAPTSNLDYADDEVAAVVSSLRAIAITGDVTQRKVVQVLGTRNWDVIWFSAHGGPSGIQLSNGELLNAAQLTQDVRNSRARLLVLNSCESEDVALRIHIELGVDVICTIAQVPDLQAYRTAAYFARAVAEGLDFRDAFERAKPGQNHTYVYLPPSDTQRMESDFVALLNQWGAMLNSRFDLLEARMSVHPARRWLWLAGAIMYGAVFVFNDVVLFNSHNIAWTTILPAMLLWLGIAILLLMVGLFR